VPAVNSAGLSAMTLFPGLLGDQLISRDGFFPSRFILQDEREGAPLTDIRETDDAIKLIMNIPGFKKDDISIDVKDNCLTISATSKKEEEKKEEKGKVVWHRRERYCGSYRRCFSLPKSVKPEDISASYEDGVLRVTAVKNEIKPQHKKIEIN
jgi:HSP20 family protein